MPIFLVRGLDRRSMMWCHALTVLIIVTIWATRKTIQHSTFVIERLQTFAKNFITNAFINDFLKVLLERLLHLCIALLVFVLSRDLVSYCAYSNWLFPAYFHRLVIRKLIDKNCVFVQNNSAGGGRSRFRISASSINRRRRQTPYADADTQFLEHRDHPQTGRQIRGVFAWAPAETIWLSPWHQSLLRFAVCRKTTRATWAVSSTAGERDKRDSGRCRS